MGEMEKISLNDIINNEIYTFYTTKEEARRAEEDLLFAEELLIRAKEDFLQDEKNDDENAGCFQNEISDEKNNNLLEIEPTNRPLDTCINKQQNVWNYNQTLELISIVESHYEEMYHPQKRKHIWQNVSNDLVSKSINVNASDCYKKWQNLVRSYKVAKDAKKKTGRGPSRFNFFLKWMTYWAPNQAIASALYRCANIPIQEKADIVQASESGKKEQEKEVDPQATPKNKKKATDELLKIKKRSLELNEEYFLQKPEEKMKKFKLMEKKLELEERKIAALEEFVKVKKNENNYK